jgi:hypothetical protein
MIKQYGFDARIDDASQFSRSQFLIIIYNHLPLKLRGINKETSYYKGRQTGLICSGLNLQGMSCLQ